MSEFSSFLLSFLSSPWGSIFAALWGLLWGSFANVCIYRIPRKESIVSPRSHCPSCQQSIRVYDNIPLLSWFFLQGRCRFCKTRIPVLYPLVEALALLFSILLYWHFFQSQSYPPNWFLLCRYLVYFFFSMVLFVISFIDWKHKIIPNIITYPAIPLFFLMGRILVDVTFWDAFLGLIIGYALIRLIADGYYFFTKREGLGYGDGKLLSLVGGLLGAKALFTSIFVGSILGIVVTIPMILIQKRKFLNQILFQMILR